MNPSAPILELEKRSMYLGMAGNLFMGAAGVVAGVLAHSGTLMLDGLFSLIGFFSAFIGLLIARRLTRAANAHRPFGYAPEEVAFTTFRSLMIAGLVLFAATGAVEKLYQYLRHGHIVVVDYQVILIYSLLIGVVCAALWLTHLYHWRRSGRRSDILRVEARGTLMDFAITASAGAGFALVYWLGEGFLAPIAPVGDAVILLLMCLFFTKSVVRGVSESFAELLHSSASPAVVLTASCAVREVALQHGGHAWDIAAVKQGRAYFVLFSYDPRAPITAAQAQALRRQFTQSVATRLPGAQVMFNLAPHAADNARNSLFYS